MGILINLQNTLAVVRKKRFCQNLHRKIIFDCLLSAKFPKLPEEKVSENVTVRVLDSVYLFLVSSRIRETRNLFFEKFLVSSSRKFLVA